MGGRNPRTISIAATCMPFWGRRDELGLLDLRDVLVLQGLQDLLGLLDPPNILEFRSAPGCTATHVEHPVAL